MLQTVPVVLVQLLAIRFVNRLSMQVKSRMEASVIKITTALKLG